LPQYAVFAGDSIASRYKNAIQNVELHQRVSLRNGRKSSRGDKTAIELFIAGIQGWEIGLRRILSASPLADAPPGAHETRPKGHFGVDT